jgi:hypothetical protein
MRPTVTTNLFLSLIFLLTYFFVNAQNRVTYAGGSGNETFYDVAQLSDGTFLVAGSATDLSWVDPSVSRTILASGSLVNGTGTNVFGFILQLNSNLSRILKVVHFPQGAVEDVKFMKFTSKLGENTGDLFISGTTSDTKANNGGYFVAKLNNNFVNGTPTALTWSRNIWAEGEIQTAQPWDVGSNGKVVYITGQYNANDWSGLYRTDANGVDEVVENFTNHWKIGGGEYYGTASAYTSGGAAGLLYSGVVLKVGNRCSLRSWTQSDFDAVIADENGGTKKGKMPLDVFYNSPCTPNVGPTTGGGYTGYTINTQTLGGTCVTVDRRANNFYLGFNMKTRLPNGNADFEPAVVAYNENGAIRWWSRLYHEITPAGALVNSSPDQYIDALAVDYATDNLLVAARCHGNNVENLWEGNTIAANPSATAFQNQFTGTNGNIHLQWLGKLRTSDGKLQRSTYFGEYVEGSNNYGTAHPDPNLDGFPNPNAGWANINTTRIPKNTIKATADGSVAVIAAGRRTMTTANAFQKMPLPSTGLTGTWNNFVRVYKPDFSVPLYSSILVGQWNTTTGVGGDNITLNAVWKTQSGVVVVGRATSGGAAMPTANVPIWGSSSENGTQSAVLAYLSATNLYNSGDGPAVVIPVELVYFKGKAVDAQNVLTWETATEINVENFEVESSLDGKIFQKIGQVAAKNSPSVYELSDKAVAHLMYYRLRTNDRDGKSTVSNVITLENKSMANAKTQPRIHAYPNPVSSVLTIENAEGQNLEIVNTLGRVVLRLEKAKEMEKINVTTLPNGVYIVKTARERVHFVKN